MSNFSVKFKGSNGTLKYKSGGTTYSASVRIREANYAYGVQSTESHARLDRAFYPHRRSLGNFILHIDCKGYTEFRKLQNFLRNYANTLFDGAMSERGNTTVMHVELPSRNFDKYGILISGIEDKDKTGSMVFDVTLTFMTLKDSNDNNTSILQTNQVSTFNTPRVNPEASLAFYPVTGNSKDQTLYDDLGNTTINPGGGLPTPPSKTAPKAPNTGAGKGKDTSTPTPGGGIIITGG